MMRTSDTKEFKNSIWFCFRQKRRLGYNKLPVVGRFPVSYHRPTKHSLKVKKKWRNILRPSQILINEFIILRWHWKENTRESNEILKEKKKTLRVYHKARSSVNLLLIRIHCIWFIRVLHISKETTLIIHDMEDSQ